MLYFQKSKPPTFSRKPYFFAVLFALAVTFWLTSAEAQVQILSVGGDPVEVESAPKPTEAQRALGLAVAKVCANEASLRRSRPADCALIYQVARRHGETPEEQLAWLSRHSRCVLGAVAPRVMRGNCRWTRQLTRRGTQPDAWNGEVARWRNFQPQWLSMLRFCDRLVMGARPRRGWPCEKDPQTWGGTMDDAVGYTLVTCRGTVNNGYMYPRWNRVRPPEIEDTVTIIN